MDALVPHPHASADGHIHSHDHIHHNTNTVRYRVSIKNTNGVALRVLSCYGNPDVLYTISQRVHAVFGSPRLGVKLEQQHRVHHVVRRHSIPATDTIHSGAHNIREPNAHCRPD